MNNPATRTDGRLGLWSGVGLVVANMIGAGVFLSAGFMAQDMGPGPILMAWATGTVIALAGARAYADVARIVPRSGGEYRYLSDLLHPVLGYAAGWTSLLVGFSAPVAVAAQAAGHFAATLVPHMPPRPTAAALVVALTVFHAVGFQVSRRTQDLLVAFKAALVAAFAVVGLTCTGWTWPTWTPPHAVPGFPLAAFMTGLFYVAFAFSGWNAAAYAAGEFAAPRRDVPRAMLIGCALVGILYLAVNWVFVARLTPEKAAVVFTYESRRITLGHLVMEDILGPAGGRVMSVLALVTFISSMSAMIFAGPRVYAAMAGDGFLPRGLAAPGGGPTARAVLLQGALALVLLFTHRLQEILQNVGAVLTLFAALTAASLFRVRFGRPDLASPSTTGLTAAAFYVVSAATMLWFGLRGTSQLAAWLAVITVAALSYYAWRGGAGCGPGD
jgi:APA family basic amino acid/polyamine antiporter